MAKSGSVVSGSKEYGWSMAGKEGIIWSTEGIIWLICQI
jgi:hypothetical protein